MSSVRTITQRSLSRRQMLQWMGLTSAGLVLASCTPPAGSAPPPSDSGAAPAAPAGSPAELEGFTPKLSPPAEPLTVLYWWGNNYEPAMQFTNEVIARFSTVYPNVTVDAVAGQNCDAFVTAAAAGTPPDLFHTWDCVERMGNWAQRGIILPLDDYVSASGFDLNDYVPGIMDTCKMDGKIWGMVDSAGVFLLWTRPSFFAEIGQDPAALPKDTDELWAWAQQLTTKDDAGDIQRLGMRMPGWTWEYFTWIANFGGVLWDATANEPTPEHAGVLEALNDLLTQVNAYGVEALQAWSAGVGSQSGAENPWLAGNAIMQVSGDWSGQSIFDFYPDWQFGQDYGAAAPPPPPASKQHGESAIAWWSWPWVLPANSKQPDWGWELLRYYLSPEYQLNVHPKFKEVVVRNSMIEDERLNWPAVQVAREIVKGARPLTTVMPMNPVAVEYSQLLSEGIENVLHLTETPADAMARVKKETLAKLQES